MNESDEPAKNDDLVALLERIRATDGDGRSVSVRDEVARGLFKLQAELDEGIATCERYVRTLRQRIARTRLRWVCQRDKAAVTSSATPSARSASTCDQTSPAVCALMCEPWPASTSAVVMSSHFPN